MPVGAPFEVSGSGGREWLAAREAELLPVGYFHVVYTLPAALRDVAYQNKRVLDFPALTLISLISV